MSDLRRFRASEQTVARSVLDRLLDDEPSVETDRARPVGEQVAEAREALRRDLEALLNTRCRPVSPPAALADALLGYGVESLFGTSLVTQDARAALARSLERRIGAFEPRLEEVSVEAAPPRGAERSLRLRIRARCKVHLGLPPMAFETRMDPATQRFHVESTRSE